MPRLGKTILRKRNNINEKRTIWFTASEVAVQHGRQCVARRAVHVLVARKYGDNAYSSGHFDFPLFIQSGLPF
jgi:hypothetical protein